ncbi:N-acetyl-glucosamine-6-phosphate deacetylase [Dimargaris xerosporica]|nr:N-acetyl-glucosamine-6-phosphate deacetylase [Dimargaris xerosporica]
MLTKIYNGRILQDHALVEDATLWIENGRILDGAETFWQAQRAPDRTIDAEGGIICPGFIDLQVNGAFGVDFSQVTEAYEQGLDRVSKGLLHHGCTAYCPTLVSSHPDVYHQVLPKLAPRKGSLDRGAEILGAHVEGPFICPDRRGAHDPATLRTAPRGLDDLYACYGQEGFAKSVRIITMAPDVDGVINTIPQVVAQGIVVSEGHSNASTAQAEEGVRRGARWITHLFNAMQQFHHRDPGLVGLLGSPVQPQRPHYGLICDGIHVHPNSIKVAYYAHPRGAVLVTDAMAALGLKPGIYALGAMRVEKHADRAYLEGTTTLAGNIITMIDSVKNFKKFTNCTVVEALEAATLHPAEVLNITHRKGTLQPGADADILILSDDLDIRRVFVAGEEVALTEGLDE